jgi:galactokinase
MEHAERSLAISTPGRVCLFGEHQDYLNLPVIAAAISRRIDVAGSMRCDRKVNIDLPDVRKRESFEIADTIPYVRERDYFRSAVNTLQRRGFHFSHGFDCEVQGTIPINAGTASSSALIVGWTNFLTRMSDQPRVLAAEEVAQIAYEAEVLEFREPGGMMDHFATSCGGLIWMESFPTLKVERLNAELGSFVLGNSHHPKDTKFILANVKERVKDIVRRVVERHPEFSLQSGASDNLSCSTNELSEEDFCILTGTVRNREITYAAKELLGNTPLEHAGLGALLNEHHVILRDVLKISTPKIDQMIDTALDAGACGAKINGSGGGGCMFAYAPQNPEAVAEAIRKVSEAVVVTIDSGSSEMVGERSV